jgi:ABC-type sugar transport system ATPase subunit
VLYMTSDVIEAMTLADSLAVLSAGTIIESGAPETLYRKPHAVGTMALVGFPPANFLRGSLERNGDGLQCVTSLFSFSATVTNGHAAADVIVGVRPERLHLSHRIASSQGRTAGAIEFPATITLREDLGGEDIVYLEAGGIALTMVDRDHDRANDLDDQVTISIGPGHLTLFDAATGERVGHGVRVPGHDAELAMSGPAARHG